jgi:hypothetical protein
MATRFYVQNPLESSVPPFPTPDAAWEKVTVVRRCAMYPAKTNTTTTGGPWNFAANGVSGTDTLCFQFISPPLAAQTITGNLKGMMQVGESALTDNYNAALVARIVSGDGATVRGTLLAAFGGGTEFPLFSPVGAIKFPPAWTGTGTALTSTDAQERDVCVIEVGVNQTSTSVGNATWRCFDNQAADIPETEGDTSTSNPWFEFTQTLLFRAATVTKRVPMRAARSRK